MSPLPTSSVLVPLYIYPLTAESWAPLYQAIEQYPSLPFTVIINPNSGPDAGVPDEDYIREIGRLNSYANVTLVGYVRVDYCKRDVRDVLRDIELYGLWGGLDWEGKIDDNYNEERCGGGKEEGKVVMTKRKEEVVCSSSDRSGNGYGYQNLKPAVKTKPWHLRGLQVLRQKSPFRSRPKSPIDASISSRSGSDILVGHGHDHHEHDDNDEVDSNGNGNRNVNLNVPGNHKSRNTSPSHRPSDNSVSEPHVSDSSQPSDQHVTHHYQTQRSGHSHPNSTHDHDPTQRSGHSPPNSNPRNANATPKSNSAPATQTSTAAPNSISPTTHHRRPLQMHGIFFDETPNLYTEAVAEYLERITFNVKNAVGLGGDKLVLHNPGTMPDAGLVDPGLRSLQGHPRHVPDVTAVFEAGYEEYINPSEWTLQQMSKCDLSRGRCAYFMHSVPKGKVREVSAELRRKAGHVFVTDLCSGFYCSFDRSWIGFVEAMAR